MSRNVAEMDERQITKAIGHFMDLDYEGKITANTSGQQMCQTGRKLFLEYCEEPLKQQFPRHYRRDSGNCPECRQAFLAILWNLLLSK